MPTLLIHGAKDQHVLPRSTEIVKEHIQTGGGVARRIIYDDMGHAPFIEDAARFNADLRSFLSGL